jgi:hypothetical protein
MTKAARNRLTEAQKAHSAAVKREVADARHALMLMLKDGPLQVHPDVIARAETMPDAEVLSLKYELRDFLRAIGELNRKK